MTSPPDARVRVRCWCVSRVPAAPTIWRRCGDRTTATLPEVVQHRPIHGAPEPRDRAVTQRERILCVFGSQIAASRSRGVGVNPGAGIFQPGGGGDFGVESPAAAPLTMYPHPPILHSAILSQ